MSSITWVEDQPSDNTTASLMDDAIRSMLTAFESGVSEFAFLEDGSAASDGEMRLGQFRMARLASIASVNALDGYLGDVAQSICHIGSQRTGLLGHQWMEEHNTDPGNAPYGARWVVKEGSFAFTWAAAASARTEETVTTGVTYNGAPFVSIVPVDDGLDGTFSVFHGVENVTTTAFDSHISVLAAPAVGSLTVQWRSEGTVSF